MHFLLLFCSFQFCFVYSFPTFSLWFLNRKTEIEKQTSGSLTFNTKAQAQSFSFLFHLFYLLDNHACFEKATPFKKATSCKTTI